MFNDAGNDRLASEFFPQTPQLEWVVKFRW
jgi:hypothetical protein